jgi:hypothetical protein
MNNPSYPLQFELKHPFQYGKDAPMITVINYRRPKAKDLKRIKPDKLETGDLIDLFAAICDQSPPCIDEMDAEDAMAAIGIVSNFLAGGQETGG